MDILSDKDHVVIDHFLSPALFDEIRTFFLHHLDGFSKAGIGSLGNNIIRKDIRGDFTYWLDRKRDTELEKLWSLIDETLYIFNRYCFLSLSGYEFHLAHYPKGGHYEKHIDQFSNRSNRMISVVIYLNKNWKKGDGGELELFLENNTTKCIEPIEGRCVLFKSANVPHRVLEAHKARYSLTGWLLNQPSALGKFLG